MRLDVISYAIGIVFFIITLTALVYTTQTTQQVWVVSTVVIGLAFLGIGYTQRPKSANAPMTTSAPPPPPPMSQPTEQTQQHQEQTAAPAPQVTTITPPAESSIVAAESTTQPVVPLQSTVPATTMEEPQQIVAPIQPPEDQLMKIKGIGQKRAAQLRTNGINSIKDLANASAKDLASKLNISPKITGKWVENAKSLEQ